MQFFILGSTGFIGTALTDLLIASGHSVSALIRKQNKKDRLPKEVKTVLGDPLSPGKWQSIAGQSDVIVNLIGRSIMARWNESIKKQILDSRILSTRMAVQSIPKQTDHKVTLINANAIGYYGFTGDKEITEKFGPGKGFLAEVCVKWQEEAEKALDKNARLVVPRFGLVLGPNGGMLSQLLPLFKLGLGGKLGSGKQYMAWIHLKDHLRALLFLAENKEIKGAVNLCSPNPVTNKKFTKELGAVLNRPTLLRVPKTALKIVLGETGNVLLEGQRAFPRVLENNGFKFEFAQLEHALQDILGPENRTD